jgi:hypothetical protein
VVKVVMFLLVFFNLFSPGIARGFQEKELPPKKTTNEIDFDFLLNHIVIEQHDGSFISGALIGIEHDTLIVRREGKDQRLSRTKIKKIVVKKEKKTKHYVYSGMFASLYGGNVLSFKNRNQPFAYSEKKGASILGLFLVESIYAAAGIGIGWLIGGIVEKDNVSFSFQENMMAAGIQWERMRNYLLGTDYRLDKFHLSAAGGQVLLRNIQRYDNHLASEGYSTELQGFNGTSFNLIRKFQMTASLSPRLETGIAVYFLGEPSTWAIKYLSEDIQKPESRVYLDLDSRGYYAVGLYKPLLPSPSNPLSWEAGAGIGWIKSDFRINTTYRIGVYPERFNINDEHTINKSFISGVIFSELKYYLYSSLSIGLIADYCFSPSEEVPAYSYMDLPAKKIRFGNASIGLNLAMHF